GLDVDAPLLVVAATGDDVRALRVLISDHVRPGGTMFTPNPAEGPIASTRSSDAPGHPDKSPERGVAEARVGLVHAPGIGSLRRSALTARELAEVLTADEDSAMTWRRGWARLAARSLNAAGNPILADVETALSAFGPVERQRLV